MWEIWAKLLLPNALNGCPKFKKIAQSGHTVCGETVAARKNIISVVAQLSAADT